MTGSAQTKRRGILDYLKKPISRRRLLTGAAALSASALTASTYAFAVEPRRVKIEKPVFTLADFPGVLNAVQISDLHMDKIDAFMAGVGDKVNSLKADFIFITGDLVEKPSYLPACLEWISGLKCGQDIFFVPGNWDHWSGTWEKGLARDLEKIGVRTLDNSGVMISWAGGKFYLLGIDDTAPGLARPRKAFKNQQPGICTIALSHVPIIVNRLDKYRCDLVLSGHTHGGQIRLPFFDAPFTPPRSGRFQEGIYRIGEKILYVNRGIGTSVIPARVLCPPEITHISIEGS